MNVRFFVMAETDDPGAPHVKAAVAQVVGSATDVEGGLLAGRGGAASERKRCLACAGRGGRTRIGKGGKAVTRHVGGGRTWAGANRRGGLLQRAATDTPAIQSTMQPLQPGLEVGYLSAGEAFCHVGMGGNHIGDIGCLGRVRSGHGDGDFGRSRGARYIRRGVGEAIAAAVTGCRSVANRLAVDFCRAVRRSRCDGNRAGRSTAQADRNQVVDAIGRHGERHFAGNRECRIDRDGDGGRAGGAAAIGHGIGKAVGAGVAAVRGIRDAGAADRGGAVAGGRGDGHTAGGSATKVQRDGVAAAIGRYRRADRPGSGCLNRYRQGIGARAGGTVDIGGADGQVGGADGGWHTADRPG